MKEFTASIKFIISFLVFTLLLGMFTNNKITYNFLVLVFFSMIVVNADKVKELLGGLRYE